MSVSYPKEAKGQRGEDVEERCARVGKSDGGSVHPKSLLLSSTWMTWWKKGLVCDQEWIMKKREAGEMLAEDSPSKKCGTHCQTSKLSSCNGFTCIAEHFHTCTILTGCPQSCLTLQTAKVDLNVLWKQFHSYNSLVRSIFHTFHSCEEQEIKNKRNNLISSNWWKKNRYVTEWTERN